MPAKGVPSQLTEEAMVLMSIFAVMHENEVRLERCLQRLEKLLNRRALKREKAGLELPNDGFFASGPVEKKQIVAGF